MRNDNRRWRGSVNVHDAAAFGNAVRQMSDAQLQFYANVLKLAAPDSHKLALEEMSRRCVLAYIEEGLHGRD